MSACDVTVDLTASPRTRWQMSADQRAAARALVRTYLRDLGMEPIAMELAEAAAETALPEVYREEIAGVAAQLDLPVRDVLLGNLYYDATKYVWGCTAFAVDSPEGPVHARNLDWWTEDELLSRTTIVTEFRNAPAGPFTTVGWPSFVGALSAVAPGRFSISLNAVVSTEAPAIALPVVFLVRQVLEEEPTYASAVRRLAETPIASDCILVIAGVETGEMCVIERTPTRSAVREPIAGAVWATNDYRLIDPDTTLPSNALGESTCGRFQRIGELLGPPPSSLRACIEKLCDERVRMGITVQQMAFRARTGELLVTHPD